MGKSRAEIQRDYRKRLKERLGDEYNKRERDRVRRNYQPSDQLSNKKRTERNLKNKIRNRKSRQRKRDHLQELLDNSIESEGTSGYSSNILDSPNESVNEPSTSVNRLVVKLPALNCAMKAKGPKKARARALARAHKTIRDLKQEQLKLQTRLARKRKQIERLNKKMKSTECKIDTPGRKTEQVMASVHLTPKRQQIVKRKLMFANVLLSEIKASKNKISLKKRKVLHHLIAGKVARKYRCISAISRETGLSRRSLSRCQTKDLRFANENRSCISKAVRDTVITFLSREDNSRTQPGRADVKQSSDGQKHQTLVLTDYLRNLHQKFTAENPNIRVSLSTFCRLRPRYILLARYISRNACQCLRHQNMAFKVQSLRKCGAKLSENPENILLHEGNLDDILTCTETDTVIFKTWKRIELENKQKKMMVVEKQVDTTVFKEMVTKEVLEFSSHVQRLRAQFQQLKLNKETLKEHHMIIQMDFAENFSCRSLDEIQTAYWNKSSVTLHPVVAYFMSDGELNHKSFVVISDVVAHSASTVNAFIDAIIPELKELDPRLQKVHYWTDSPSSQYRNRFIFRIVAKHEDLYGCAAQWNYFEAGHGKSACDGLGGTTKRLADESIRQGNTTIQDAHDFYVWAQQSSMKEVKFVFVGKDTCEKKACEFSSVNVKPVKNTMKLHAIAVCASSFKTNATSCYCKSCLDGDFCSAWNEEKLEISSDTGNETSNVKENVSESKVREFKAGEFVAARYEGAWYVGQIEDVDAAEDDCKVNFMERAKGLFKWPKQRDELWVNGIDILCKVAEPVRTGRSCRMFRISVEETEKIEGLL